jgi:hypothetical protein
VPDVHYKDGAGRGRGPELQQQVLGIPDIAPDLQGAGAKASSGGRKRPWEGEATLAASRLLDKGSHILKYFLEHHRDEDFETLRFGMKAVRFLQECIRGQIHHIIISSTAGLSTIVVLCLGLGWEWDGAIEMRWGDREYKSLKKEETDERRKEEEIDNLIRKMKKREKLGENVWKLEWANKKEAEERWWRWSCAQKYSVWWRKSEEEKKLT